MLASKTRFWSLAYALSLSYVASASDIQTSSTQLKDRQLETLDIHSTDVNTTNPWNLTQRELERVKQLNEGIRQHLSVDNISPLEVLGIHARSDEERKRYAVQWAKQVLADTQRVLAFQRAYDEAIRELTQGQPLIDLAELPPNQEEPVAVLASDRLALFVKTGCPHCEQLLKQVLPSILKVAGLDIYFYGLTEKNGQLMRRWAQVNQIPPQAVAAGRITLNVEDGLLHQIHPRADSLPVLLKRTGEQFSLLHPDDLP